MQRMVFCVLLSVSSICPPHLALAQSATTLPAVVVPAEAPGKKAAPAKRPAQASATSSGPSQPPAAPPAAQAGSGAGAVDPVVASAEAWPPSADALRGNIPLVGVANTASSGIIGQDRLEARSPFRPAEVLEAVPGLIITQHSGEGKANQYYLR